MLVSGYIIYFKKKKKKHLFSIYVSFIVTAILHLMVRLTGDAWPPEEGLQVDIPLDVPLSECLEVFSEALLLDDAVVDYDVWAIDPPDNYSEIDDPFELTERRMSQITYDRSLIEQGLLVSDCVLYFTKTEQSSIEEKKNIVEPSTPVQQFIPQINCREGLFDTPSSRLQKLKSLRQVTSLSDSRSTDGITNSTITSSTTRADVLAASVASRHTHLNANARFSPKESNTDTISEDADYYNPNESAVPIINSAVGSAVGHTKRPTTHFINKKPSPLCPISAAASSSNNLTRDAINIDREASCGVCTSCVVM